MLPAPRTLLPAEDYNWWWRSFLTSGSSALYLFGYAIVYFVTKLDITGATSTALYFGCVHLTAPSWRASTGLGNHCALPRRQTTKLINNLTIPLDVFYPPV